MLACGERASQPAGSSQGKQAGCWARVTHAAEPRPRGREPRPVLTRPGRPAGSCTRRCRFCCVSCFDVPLMCSFKGERSSFLTFNVSRTDAKSPPERLPPGPDKGNLQPLLLPFLDGKIYKWEVKELLLWGSRPPWKPVTLQCAPSKLVLGLVRDDLHLHSFSLKMLPEHGLPVQAVKLVGPHFKIKRQKGPTLVECVHMPGSGGVCQSSGGRFQTCWLCFASPESLRRRGDVLACTAPSESTVLSSH